MVTMCCQFANDSFFQPFTHNNTLHCGACGEPRIQEKAVATATLTSIVHQNPITLHNGINTIGRDGTNRIQFTWGMVSRKHCTIWKDDAGWWVRDEGSSNGTHINGYKLEPFVTYVLSDKDRVIIGGVGFLFEEN